MLIGIDPILAPDLLCALRSMGHGHEVAIVDANFPCDPLTSRVIRLDDSSSPRVLEAIMSVMPLESSPGGCAWRMIVDGDPEERPEVIGELIDLIASRAPDRLVQAVTPEEFKEKVKGAFATVVTGERRLYGSLIVRKGVVPPSP